MTVTTTVPSVPIDQDLAKQLARSRDQIDKAQHARDELILLAFAQGASLREIADVAGITHTGVKKLVERLQPDYVVLDGDGNVLSIMEAKQTAGDAYVSHKDHVTYHLASIRTIEADRG